MNTKPLLAVVGICFGYAISHYLELPNNPDFTVGMAVGALIYGYVLK